MKGSLLVLTLLGALAVAAGAPAAGQPRSLGTLVSGNVYLGDILVDGIELSLLLGSDPGSPLSRPRRAIAVPIPAPHTVSMGEPGVR